MKPGIHQISMAEYLKIPALSSSIIRELLACSPAHAKYRQDNPSDGSTEADIGTAIHDVLLEGRNRIAEIPFDDFRKTEAKAQRDLARLENRIPVLSHKVPQIEAAVAAARAHVEASEIRGVFANGKPEQTIVWEEGKILCKARPDWLTTDHRVMLHVKTTAGSASPESWIRNQLVLAGYNTALTFYERGLYAARGDGRDVLKHSLFLVIEQEPPHGCSLIGLHPAMRDLASSKVERAIRQWERCFASGKFPSYPYEIAYAEPKPWDLAQEEEQQLGDAYDHLQGKHGLQI